MANETITGCVDWNTGIITFTQDPCEYTGCIVWEGVHAGQVAVTINNSCCDDTYYGCINWITGEFQLEIPDSCCDATCPCEMCNCSSGGTYQPDKVEITFADILDCCFYGELGGTLYYSGISGVASVLNGTHSVLRYGDCTYRKVFTGPWYWYADTIGCDSCTPADSEVSESRAWRFPTITLSFGHTLAGGSFGIEIHTAMDLQSLDSCQNWTSREEDIYLVSQGIADSSICSNKDYSATAISYLESCGGCAVLPTFECALIHGGTFAVKTLGFNNECIPV